MRRIGLMAVVVAVVATACGGGSLSTEEEALVDEITTAMNITPPEGFPPELFGEAEARCWAEAMVIAVAAEDLERVGFGAGGFQNQEEADAALDAVIDLLSPEETEAYVIEVMECVDFSPLVAEGMIADGFPRDASYCIAEKMVESDAFLASMVASVRSEVPSEAIESEMMSVSLSAMSECLSAEDFADLMSG